jgi:outer membrane usher protein
VRNSCNSRNFTTSSTIATTPTTRLLTATYSHSFFKNISLSVGFVGDLRNSQTNQAFLGLVFSPDKLHIASNYTSWQNHQLQDALQLTKPTPLGVGYGYDLFVSNNSNRYAGVDFTVQNQIGAYTARLGKGWGQANYELDASGSVIYFTGNSFLARKMTNSFGLIQVPGYSNVDVFYQHQLMGHTDKNGNLLITGLLPYQENLLEIEPTTLPLDVQINNLAKTVMPYLYSGVLAKFPVKHIQGLIVHLLKPNGQFVSVGAEVCLNYDPETLYTVGYEGELYIPDIHTPQLLDGLVIEGGERYHFSVELPRTTDIIIEIGKLICI